MQFATYCKEFERRKHRIPKTQGAALAFLSRNLSLTERSLYVDIAELRVQIPSKPRGKVVGVQVIFLWGDVMGLAEDMALEWVEELRRIRGELIKSLGKRRVPKRYWDSPGWAKQKPLSEEERKKDLLKNGV